MITELLFPQPPISNIQSRFPSASLCDLCGSAANPSEKVGKMPTLLENTAETPARTYEEVASFLASSVSS
jgi:hypothetical protein